mmetsp:Transcript_106694/g.286958  ORF Transcript_106694/g.286958 Transcript_106694/m.286958 type:complete len:201 (-) Transcript_106694:356-958(-)
MQKCIRPSVAKLRPMPKTGSWSSSRCRRRTLSLLAISATACWLKCGEVQTGSCSSFQARLGESTRRPEEQLEEVSCRSTAPSTTSWDNSFLSFPRIMRASSWSSAKWSSGIALSVRPVTSACMPMRYHNSSSVSRCLAMVRPRRSSRLMNISPDFFRLGNSAVNVEPLSLANLRPIKSIGEMGHPWLRNRQFTPRISLLL